MELTYTAGRRKIRDFASEGRPDANDPHAVAAHWVVQAFRRRLAGGGASPWDGVPVERLRQIAWELLLESDQLLQEGVTSP